MEDKHPEMSKNWKFEENIIYEILCLDNKCQQKRKGLEKQTLMEFLPGATSIGFKLLLIFVTHLLKKNHSTILNIFTAFQIQRFRKN